MPNRRRLYCHLKLRGTKGPVCHTFSLKGPRLRAFPSTDARGTTVHVCCWVLSACSCWPREMCGSNWSPLCPLCCYPVFRKLNINSKSFPLPGKIKIIRNLEESERPAAGGSQTQDTSGLCSATEPWQLDNHQLSQSLMGPGFDSQWAFNFPLFWPHNI